MAKMLLRVTNIFLCVAAIATAVVTIVSIFIPLLQIRVEVYAALFLTIAGAILAHLLQHGESVDERLDQLASRGARVEVYRSNDEWAGRLIAVTPESQRVSTQMFSDAPHTVGVSYEKYFKEVHRALKNGRIRSFRRIANTGGPEKVRWLLGTIAELSNVEAFSLAIADVDHVPMPLTALHVCETASSYYTFVFSSVPATGVMTAFMVQDRQVGLSAQQTYDVLWERARKLKEGKRIDYDAVTELAVTYGLTECSEYARLRALRTA